MGKKVHGMSKTKFHNTWWGMISRCEKKTNPRYRSYGALGIKVCKRWRNSFINFYEDMKEGFAPHLTLDRINPNGNYEPNNCRWATWQEQAENKRNTQFLTIDGETKRLVEWSKISGYSDKKIRQRLVRNGYSAKEAVFNPPKSDCVIVCHTPTGVFYDSITEAIKYSNFSKSQITKMMAGYQRNTSGLVRC